MAEAGSQRRSGNAEAFVSPIAREAIAEGNDDASWLATAAKEKPNGISPPAQFEPKWPRLYEYQY